MLQTLRKLFEPETAAPAPQAGGGKLTLRDVLLRDWVSSGINLRSS
jgi:hypothetical protein